MHILLIGSARIRYKKKHTHNDFFDFFTRKRSNKNGEHCVGTHQNGRLFDCLYFILKHHLIRVENQKSSCKMHSNSNQHKLFNFQWNPAQTVSIPRHNHSNSLGSSVKTGNPLIRCDHFCFDRFGHVSAN